MNTDTLERIVPDSLNKNEDTGSKTLKFHLERYQFTSKNLKPGLLLDIACGVGYGSFLLVNDVGDNIQKITSVDISNEAIEYARIRYANPKIEFICADATTFCAQDKFDTIISLETIEHVPNPENFVAHLKTLLKEDGIFIASVPVTPSVDANPHHLTDFTKKSFRKIFLNSGFEEVCSHSQVQPFSLFKVITKQEKRMQQMRKNILKYYLMHPQSFLKRIFSTLTDGFNNRYLTVVWKLKSKNNI